MCSATFLGTDLATATPGVEQNRPLLTLSQSTLSSLTLSRQINAMLLDFKIMQQNYTACPQSSARQHPSYGDCLEVKREYYQNCSVLGCVTQCSQSAAHLNEQFLQVRQIGFVTLGPLRHA